MGTCQASQFRLWHAFAGVTLFSLALAILVSSHGRGIFSDVLQIAAYRLLLIVLITALVGVPFGAIPKAFVAAAIAVVFADAMWIWLLNLLGSGIDRSAIVINPLLFMVVPITVAAVISNPVRAIATGVVLSIVIPVAFVTAMEISFSYQISRNPSLRGLGLAQMIVWVVSKAMVLTGISGVIAAKAIPAVVIYISNRVRSFPVPRFHWTLPRSWRRRPNPWSDLGPGVFLGSHSIDEADAHAQVLTAAAEECPAGNREAARGG